MSAVSCSVFPKRPRPVPSGAFSVSRSFDQADRYRFDSIMARAISNFQIAREFYANGLLEDSVLEANKRTIVGLLASSGGSAWWKFAQASYEAPLRDELTRALADRAAE